MSKDNKMVITFYFGKIEIAQLPDIITAEMRLT